MEYGAGRPQTPLTAFGTGMTGIGVTGLSCGVQGLRFGMHLNLGFASKNGDFQLKGIESKVHR